MTEHKLKALLRDLSEGRLSADEVFRILKAGPFADEEAADSIPDHHRAVRTGFAEVIFGENKNAQQIVSILRSLDTARPVLVTRIDAEKTAAIETAFPGCRRDAVARTAIVRCPDEKRLTQDEARTASEPFVLVLTAGTSDLPVAREAVEVCVAREAAYCLITDAGVAGLHRILSRAQILQNAAAIVVCAGMEGALPGVVAGLCGKPVFAVPTSIGYGANMGGFAALLTMLNSCGSGVSVVNIDAGFSAAFSACSVVQEIKRFQAASSAAHSG